MEFNEGLCSILSMRAVNTLLDSFNFNSKAIICSFDESVVEGGWFEVTVLTAGSCKYNPLLSEVTPFLTLFVDILDRAEAVTLFLVFVIGVFLLFPGIFT